MELDRYRTHLDRLTGQRDVLLGQIAEKEKSIRRKSVYVDDLIEARRIVSEVASMTQVQFKAYVENLVTLALQSVFPEKDYKFVVDFDIKRNRTEANLLIRDGDKPPYVPSDEQAGSIIDIISFVLRIVLWSLKNPKSRNVIVLDEPFRFTGALVGVAGQMMKVISRQLGIQILLVTHSQELADVADRSWAVSRMGDLSEVRLCDVDSTSVLTKNISAPAERVPKLKRRK